MAKTENPAPPTPNQANSLPTRLVGIDDVHPDPANARLHDGKNLDAIKNSLKHHGQVENLLVQRSTGKIIGGNGRYQAMRELGWQKVSVTYLEMNDTQAAGLAIALNRTAELGRWDNDALQKLMEGLKEDFPIDELGFDEQEMSRLLQDELDLSGAEIAGDLEGDSGPSEGGDSHSGDEGPAPSHVRLVQLFFNETTHPEFMDLADQAQEQFQTDNLTDTVLAALRLNSKNNQAD